MLPFPSMFSPDFGFDMILTQTQNLIKEKRRTDTKARKPERAKQGRSD